jgi:hypothetical protein
MVNVVSVASTRILKDVVQEQVTIYLIKVMEILGIEADTDVGIY